MILRLSCGGEHWFTQKMLHRKRPARARPRPCDPLFELWRLFNMKASNDRRRRIMFNCKRTVFRHRGSRSEGNMRALLLIAIALTSAAWVAVAQAQEGKEEGK